MISELLVAVTINYAVEIPNLNPQEIEAIWEGNKDQSLQNLTSTQVQKILYPDFYGTQEGSPERKLISCTSRPGTKPTKKTTSKSGV